MSSARGPGFTWCGCEPKHFDAPWVQLAFDAEHEAVLQAEARRDRLEVAMAADSEFTRVVHRLGCLRGVSTLTAFGLAVEVGDWIA